MEDMGEIFEEVDLASELADVELDEEIAFPGPSDVLPAVEEMDLASHLLEVTNEAEFDQLLGRLIHRVGKVLGRSMKIHTTHALGLLLKRATQKILPALGLGTPTGLSIPESLGLGFTTKNRTARDVGRIFGVELEGLSPEDQEFEVARRLVRFLSTAARSAALAQPWVPPSEVARLAVTAAAKRHAPGLLSRMSKSAT